MLSHVALGIAALVSSLQEREPAPYQPEKCLFDLERGFLRAAPLAVSTLAAGETQAFRVYYSRSPGDFSQVPNECLKGWRVSAPKVVTLARDRKSLTVAKTAEAGTEFTISFTYRGQRVAQQYRVIAPVVSPLTGFWSQENVEGCAADTRMFDLVFGRDGSFGVAFGPRFHGSKDYSGKWRVEGDRLILSEVTGEKPTNLVLEARFTIDATGGLTFDKPWFGTQGRRGTCTEPFVKVR
ncbi:MAG: hypothetical protein CVT77_18005 [Alphaproteobacteria bacterium HGW-Alphaproteobacteria-16]|nr:MAG: hypothetical protein CVT77_18005 [Alphaproteobacteria bacterium HGW-Alphaproteobacteria-16]